MIDVDGALAQIARDLGRLHREWALVGGLAVCVRAAPRPTVDIDVAVAASDDSAAEAVVSDLVTAGYHRRESIRHEVTGRLATTRLVSPVTDEEVGVNLFFASCGVEAEIVGAAELLQVSPGLTVPVASMGHLIAVKFCWRGSAKRDRDLRALIDRADTEDLADARQLMALITERGYHRGRDLQAELDTWLCAQ